MAARLKSQERRKAPRVSERVALAVTDAKLTLRTETKNLSASGAYCTLDRFLAPMTKLQLQFELPDGPRHSTVRCAGVVVRVEPVVANAQQGLYNVAIFFTEVAARDRSVITRFVQRRLAATTATATD